MPASGQTRKYDIRQIAATASRSGRDRAIMDRQTDPQGAVNNTIAPVNSEQKAHQVMFTRLFRQRRRIIVLVLCAMLAGALHYGAGRMPLVWGLAACLAACLVITLAPNRRRWIEALGIGLVIAAASSPHVITFPVAVIGSATLAYLAIHSPWTDRFLLRFGLTSQRISRVRASPAQVWAALIPGESHPDDHWTGTLADFDHDPDDPLTTYLRYRTPDGLHEDVTVTFLDHSPLCRCRYVIERFEEGFAEAGTMLIEIAETVPDECQITSRLSYDALPLRVALGRWLDDTFGDEWDSFAAMVCARRDWSIHGLRRRMGNLPIADI